MNIDFTTLPGPDRYRLMTNFIGQRPIALVGTRSPTGGNNAAPMSFFNVANIRRTGEFVANMVDIAAQVTPRSERAVE